jgi:hypothetical protein
MSENKKNSYHPPLYPFGELPEIAKIKDEVERGTMVSLVRTEVLLEAKPFDPEYNSLQFFNHLILGQNEDAALRGIFISLNIPDDQKNGELIAFSSFISGEYYFLYSDFWDRGSYLDLIVDAIEKTNNQYFKNQCMKTIVENASSYIEYLENMTKTEFDKFIEESSLYFYYLVNYGYKLLALYSSCEQKKNRAFSSIIQIKSIVKIKCKNNENINKEIDDIIEIIKS